MIWYLGDGKTRVAGSVLRGCNDRIYIFCQVVILESLQNHVQSGKFG